MEPVPIESHTLSQPLIRSEIIRARNGVDVYIVATPVRYNIRCFVVCGGEEKDVKCPCLDVPERDLDEQFACIRDHFQTHGVSLNDNC
jgi:hypothetical protein